MSESVLSAKNVTFSVSKKRILNQVSFEVQKGSVFAIVGHNGAGKTTLFHILLGLKFQTEGEVTLHGKSNLDHHSREKLGYVPERPYLNLEYSLSSFLFYHANLLGISHEDRAQQVQSVAKIVGLESSLDQDLSTFSKGMLQKSLIAQATLGNPDLLILDEPMSGLDPESRESVRKLIIDLKNQGKTLIFSSHALEDVEQLADRVLILKAGDIQFLGTVEEWRLQR